jgi:hypothetical protein
MIKKFFAAWALLLAAACLLFGQGSRKDDTAFKNTVAGIAGAGGALITACTSAGAGIPCTPLATIYSDLALTAPATNITCTRVGSDFCTNASVYPNLATNPFKADANGNYGFYVSPGRYVVTITDSGTTGIQAKSITYTIACDPTQTCTVTASWNFTGGLQANGVAVPALPINLATQVTGTLPGTNLANSNLTIDAEASGNTITVPSKVWLPAAGCNNATASSFWDLPTATPAAAACVTGTNTQKGVLDYADTAGGFSAQTTELLPADFTGNIDARIIWFTPATSGNAKWSLSTICTSVSAAATDDPAFNTASTVTTAAPGSANQIQTSSISAVTITGCSAGQLLHVKLFRDGNDAADTITNTARFYGLELTIRRAM